MLPHGQGIRLQWAASKRKRAPAISYAEWATHRDEISRLHATTKLDDLMAYMTQHYGFSPSKHQYVLQLQKWGFRKYKSKEGSNSATTNSPASSTTTAQAATTQVTSLPTELIDSNMFDQMYDEFDLSDFVPDFTIPGSEPNAADSLLPLDDSDANLDVPHGFDMQERERTIEEQIADALSGNDQLANLDLSQHVVPSSPTLSDYATSVSPSRSIKLQRVPRAQKRPRSITSIEPPQHAPKRNRTDSDDDDDDDDDDDEEDGKSLNSPLDVLVSEDQLTIDVSAANRSINATQSPLTSEHSLPDLPADTTGILSADSTSVTSEDSSNAPIVVSRSASQAGESHVDEQVDYIPGETSLKRLFRLARHGQVLGPSDYKQRSKIERIAWFLFGAGLYEEAFILHLLLFKTLQALRETDDSTLFEIVINLTRCSRTEAQNQIVKELLLKASRKRHWGRWGDPLENFLLHSFLTLVYRRQDNLDKADHHCHRAIGFFQMSRQSKEAASARWHSLSVVAWSLLRASITEKRLQVKGAEITNSVRRRVCARASDQLIMNLLRSDESNSTHERTLPNHNRCTALRTLFEWCLQALEDRETGFDARQPWRKFRAEGLKLRNLGMITLYCELWKAWHQDATENTLTYTVSEYWSSTIETELGINPSECLATIPETIAMEWPVLDEDIPLLANWRTYRSELHHRAASNLRQLLKFSDTKLAHHFFRSYSSHCIASSKPDSEHYLRLHRDCVMSFVNENVDLMLPNLSLQEHTSESGNRNSTFAEQGVQPTSDESHDSVPAPSNAPTVNTRINVPTIDPAMTRSAYRNSTTSSGSMSLDLESMKGIQRRNAERKIKRQVSDAENKLPSRAMPDIDTMSIDGMLGLTRRSIESLSLHEDDGSQEDDSLTKLFSRSSSSLLDVMVH